MAGLFFDAPFKEFESSLCALGSYLGYESERKDDNGDGPDIYWLDRLQNIGWAIEAKNEKLSVNPLNKKEAGQLRTACAWLRQKRKVIESIGVSVHPNKLANCNASASDLRVLLPEALDELRRETRIMLTEIDSFIDDGAVRKLALVLMRKDLGLEGISRRYLRDFIDAEKASGDH